MDQPTWAAVVVVAAAIAVIVSFVAPNSADKARTAAEGAKGTVRDADPFIEALKVKHKNDRELRAIELARKVKAHRWPTLKDQPVTPMEVEDAKAFLAVTEGKP